MTSEEKYITKRLIKAAFQSIPFYFFRVFPINRKKIVFTCIEGTTGYTCNPKYIAEEFIRQNKSSDSKFELVWLVNDITKEFPKEIKVCKNTLWNRAYQLTTAKFWIDNSRKQLEVRKRKGQVYIQTWHAKLGFKPTCLDRGESFSRIAYLVSKHDSDMVDYWLSNSDWYDSTLKTGSLYEGKTLRCGSPRCDILVKARDDACYKKEVKNKLCKIFEIEEIDVDNIHFMMYAPTFRGGSQETNRTVEVGNHFPDYVSLKKSLEKRFGGKWYIMLRLHPQLVARGLDGGFTSKDNYLLDGSIREDMYELLAGCDAFMTDYSSAAFDAAVMMIPIFLYCDDYKEYECERGKLLWNLRELPFKMSEDNHELIRTIEEFDRKTYLGKVKDLFDSSGMIEDGKGSWYVAELITSNFFRRIEGDCENAF